jgi:hypothetical protein
VDASVDGQRRVTAIGQHARDPAVERFHRPNKHAADRALAIVLEDDAADRGDGSRPLGKIRVVRGHANTVTRTFGRTG